MAEADLIEANPSHDLAPVRDDQLKNPSTEVNLDWGSKEPLSPVSEYPGGLVPTSLVESVIVTFRLILCPESLERPDLK